MLSDITLEIVLYEQPYMLLQINCVIGFSQKIIFKCIDENISDFLCQQKMFKNCISEIISFLHLMKSTVFHYFKNSSIFFERKINNYILIIN